MQQILQFTSFTHSKLSGTQSHFDRKGGHRSKLFLLVTLFTNRSIREWRHSISLKPEFKKKHYFFPDLLLFIASIVGWGSSVQRRIKCDNMTEMKNLFLSLKLVALMIFFLSSFSLSYIQIKTKCFEKCLLPNITDYN